MDIEVEHYGRKFGVRIYSDSTGDLCEMIDGKWVVVVGLIWDGEVLVFEGIRKDINMPYVVDGIIERALLKSQKWEEL